MVDCRLSRRDLDYYRFQIADRPDNYYQCSLGKDEVRKLLQPDQLDGRPGLSAVERLCFRAAWDRFSMNQNMLHVSDLERMRADLRASYTRLSSTTKPVQYVGVRFDFGDLQREFQLSSSQLEFLNRSWQHFVRSSRFHRLRAILDSVYPNGPTGRQEELEERRRELGLAAFVPQDEVLQRDVDEKFGELLFRDQTGAAGYTFWKSLAHYLEPSASEFGNPTADEECYVFARAVLDSVMTPDAACGEASEEFLNQLAQELADVAVHELGHAFGLTHEMEQKGVMVPGDIDQFRAPVFNVGELSYLRKLFSD